MAPGQMAYEAYESHQINERNCSVDRWEDLDSGERQSWAAAEERVIMSVKVRLYNDALQGRLLELPPDWGRR
jgi:hypothetical protein